jgi:NADH-quinone oxidoreductase subunit J
MSALVFQVAGVLSIVAAMLVATRRNPVYGAIFLIVFFILVSAQFLVLGTSFLAAVQVFIYAGAIMVLFVFVIMLLNLTTAELEERVPLARKLTAAGSSLCLFVLLVNAIRRSSLVHSPAALDLLAIPPPGTAPPPGTVLPGTVLPGTVLPGTVLPGTVLPGTVEALGESLFSSHVLAFEFSSILILVAIIGAIYLTKKRSAPASGIDTMPTPGEAPNP